MPSRAQQIGIGMDSTNPAPGGLATGSGAVRITPSGAALGGTEPLNLTVAFMGVSGVGAMRAVSLRKVVDASRFATGARPGFVGGGGNEALGSLSAGAGAGGRAIGGMGGRFAGVPAAGGNGFGATKGGGGRTPTGEDGEFAPGAGGWEAPGGRAGKLIRVVSFSTGTVGRLVGRGGTVIRTVSFFGSFKSAILL